MKKVTHACMVPLIGGMVIGQELALGSRPDYIMSFSPFENSDAHLLNYYNNEVPYVVIDEGQKHPHAVDIVTSVCPCAGLSSLSGHAASDKPVNDWMYTTANYVLEQVRPKVYMGENAPGLAGKIGVPVVEKLREIGKKNGYVFSIYRTRSALHGIPQVRERSFYYFWKGDRIPLLEYVEQSGPTIQELIKNVPSTAPQYDILTSPRIPSEDPFYRYILEEIHPGFKHKDFAKHIDITANVMSYIESQGIKYDRVAKWCKKQKLTKLADKCLRVHTKLEAGGSVMRHATTIPKERIGAFVGHMPTMMTHPSCDRYLNVRECLSIMGMPEDFILLNPISQLNHVCQNVPVGTAKFAVSQALRFLQGDIDTVRAEYLIQSNAKQSYDIQDEVKPTGNLDNFI